MAAQVKPLFDTIKVSQATVRPLEMAGFDMQVPPTAKLDQSALPRTCGRFVAGLRDQAFIDRATGLAEQGLAARGVCSPESSWSGMISTP